MFLGLSNGLPVQKNNNDDVVITRYLTATSFHLHQFNYRERVFFFYLGIMEIDNEVALSVTLLLSCSCDAACVGVERGSISSVTSDHAMREIQDSVYY